MTTLLKGVRPLDYVLAGVMTAAGIFLMYMNMTSTEKVPHPPSTTGWAIVPLFVLVTLPILWRRRNILAVIVATGAATALHIALFGWLTRCGVELPLTFALAYTVGRFGGSRANRAAGLAVIVAVQVLMCARDSSIDTVLGAMPIAIPGAALLYGIGVFVQSRSTRAATPAPAVAESVAA